MKKQDESATRCLLSHGVDPDYRPSCTLSIIFLAMKNAGTSKINRDLVNILLSYGPNLEARAPTSMTTLYYAVKARRQFPHRTSPRSRRQNQQRTPDKRRVSTLSRCCKESNPNNRHPPRSKIRYGSQTLWRDHSPLPRCKGRKHPPSPTAPLSRRQGRVS